jgi:dolichyl-phosphate-mannose-protein mannosyltransferase
MLILSSVKMIGMFVTALVGLYTVEDLWEKFGDLKMPVVSPPRSQRSVL